MFSFTNKKAMGVWSSEVKYIKWMEKSEVIQKRYSENIGWKYHIISLVIDIIFICFLYALISLLSIR